MDWIYLSTHFDDVALSCGGLLWRQTQAGERASVWTICTGQVPAGQLSPFAQSLHERWESGQDAVTLRRVEDFGGKWQVRCTVEDRYHRMVFFTRAYKRRC